MKKVAIIVGGGGNIGRACAFSLAADGYEIAVTDVNLETAQRTAMELTECGKTAHAYAVDVTCSAAVNDNIAAVLRDFGRIDAVVYTAGGSARKQMAHLVRQTDEVIQTNIAVNLLGALYYDRAAANVMIEQGMGGRLIHISSIVGIQGSVGCVEYSAAKGGLIAMTKSLAMELGEYGITVNCVAPGLVPRPDDPTDTSCTNYLHQIAKADGVADVVAFLASEKGSFITGQNYVIDGGRSLGLKAN